MNNVQLMGNLARDPKVSVTRTGKTLVQMTVACSEIYKGKDGQAKEMTSFVLVTCWPPSSDLAQNLLKGDRVVVMGRFTTNSYEKDGTKHYYSEVTANYVGTVPKAVKAAAPGESFENMGNTADDEEIPF